MKNFSAGGGGSGGGNMRPFDEYDVYFSTYMSPPPHHHHHHSKHGSYSHHIKAEEPKAVPADHYCSHIHGHRMVAKGLDPVNVDFEASEFIEKRHKKLELAKFMSMAP